MRKVSKYLPASHHKIHIKSTLILYGIITQLNLQVCFLRREKSFLGILEGLL